MESASNHPPQAPLLGAEQPKSSGSVPAGSSGFSHRSGVWFHRLTIEQRVLAGFSLVFVGILIVSAISYHNTSILLTNNELDGRSYDLIQLLNNIDAAMSEAEDAHRRYLVTGEASYLEIYKKVVKQKPTFVAYLNDLIRGSPEQQQRVGLLDRMMDRQLNVESKAISQFQEGGFRAVKKMAFEGAGRRELGVIRQIITDMDVHERQAVGRRVMESAAGTRNTIILFGIGALLQLVLLAWVYYLVC
jgi:CHASE3 domain sensor protein